MSGNLKTLNTPQNLEFEILVHHLSQNPVTKIPDKGGLKRSGFGTRQIVTSQQLHTV